MPTFRNHASREAGEMHRLVRWWLALAAMGAGIAHLALAWVVAVRLSGVHPVAGGALAGVLALVGTAELAWGLVALVIDRVAVPGVARWASLAPVAAWALVIVSGATVGGLALPFLPMGSPRCSTCSLPAARACTCVARGENRRATQVVTTRRCAASFCWVSLRRAW